MSTQLIHIFESEWLKTKRSAVSWLILVGGFFIPSIMLAARLIRYSDTFLENSTEGVWERLFNQSWQYMSIFLLPMGITLAASLITQIEFRNNSWKQVFASPQSLSSIFWVKYIVILLILAQFFILFNIGIYMVGIVPALVFKEIPFPPDKFPFIELLTKNSLFFIKCLPILSIQYLFSLHIRNFMVPIGLGFIILLASMIGLSWEYGYLLPYTYGSIQYLSIDRQIDKNITIEHWAMFYFIFFTLLNYWIFIYKNRQLSKVKSKFHYLGKVAFRLVVLCFIFFFNKNEIKISNQSNSIPNVNEKIKQFEESIGLVKFKVKGRNLNSIEERMKHYDIKGVSIAVINDYKIEWAKGYGLADEESKKRVTSETLFMPGSISKAVNSLAFWKLFELNKIDFFQDINNYLTSFKFPYNPTITKNKKITIAQLLSHTAGLNIHGFGFYGYTPNETLPTTLQIVKGEKPSKIDAVKSILEPAKRFKYSGGGTMISQLILEDFTHENYEDYLLKAILRPLGMNHSFFNQPPPDDKIPFLATGYTMMNQGKALKSKYPIQPEKAAAGLWTTPTDLAKMVIEIQKSLRGDKNSFFSKNTSQLMLTPYLDKSATMGFYVENHNHTKYFHHAAGNPGMSGKFIGSVDGGKGVVILVNSDDDAPFFEEVIHAVADVYNWEGFDEKEKPVEKSKITLNQDLKNRYLGVYKIGNQVFTIQQKQNELYFIAGEDNIWQMHFTDSNHFINLESKSEKFFEWNSTSKNYDLVIQKDKKFLKANKIKEVLISQKKLKQYAGEYMEEGNELAKIEFRDKNIWIISENFIAPIQAHFLNNKDFYIIENGGIYSFELSDKGVVTGVKSKQNGRIILKRKL